MEQFNDRKKDVSGESLALTTFVVLEPGIYNARLENIGEMAGTFGPTLIFSWVVLDGDYVNETFDGLCSKTFGTRSKLYKWACAHMGVTTFPEGYILQLRQLLHKQVVITLGVEARKDGTGDRNKVEAITPYRAPGTARRAPAQAGVGGASVLPPNVGGGGGAPDNAPTSGAIGQPVSAPRFRQTAPAPTDVAAELDAALDDGIPF